MKATLPYKILVIEDQPDVQMLFKAILDPYIVDPGALWMAFGMADAKGIIEARQDDISVVVTDLTVAESTWCDEGHARCCAKQVINLLTHPTPIIACSGTISPGLCCLALGVEDFLNKGDMVQLPMRIHAAVGRFRARMLAFRAMQEQFGNEWKF
jgi:CheY-like chemotaxis protein